MCQYFISHVHVDMATHSSTLVWRILCTEQPGGLVLGVAKSQTRLKRLNYHASTFKNYTKNEAKHKLSGRH